jgi:hypothetical protein
MTHLTEQCGCCCEGNEEYHGNIVGVVFLITRYEPIISGIQIILTGVPIRSSQNNEI